MDFSEWRWEKKLEEGAVEDQERFALRELPGRAADGAGGGQNAEVGTRMQKRAIEVADHGRAHGMTPALALNDGTEAATA